MRLLPRCHALAGAGTGETKRRSNCVDFMLPATMCAAVSEQLSALPTLGRRTLQLPTAAAAPLRQQRVNKNTILFSGTFVYDTKNMSIALI